MVGKKFDPLTDYAHDLYSPSSNEEKRKAELAQKEADDYFSHIATTDNSIPGYENVPVDAGVGVLSGMLTDDPEIRKAVITWLNNLSDIDTDAIKRVIASKEFRDMYGKPDFDWRGGKSYNAAEAEEFIDNYNKWLDKQNGTNISNIASAIMKSDVGRLESNQDAWRGPDRDNIELPGSTPDDWYSAHNGLKNIKMR